jgi:hypothetical protein
MYDAETIDEFVDRMRDIEKKFNRVTYGDIKIVANQMKGENQ